MLQEQKTPKVRYFSLFEKKKKMIILGNME